MGEAKDEGGVVPSSRQYGDPGGAAADAGRDPVPGLHNIIAGKAHASAVSLAQR
jgi:hypothetical protein